MLPAWLDWIDVVVSLIAFGAAVVTLPTAFQMWWGRPSLSVEFKTGRYDSGVHLGCRIENAHITNKVLRILRVTRETARAVKLRAKISVSGSGEIIGRTVPNISVEGMPQSSRVDLHPGVPAFAQLIFQRQGGAAGIGPPKDDGGPIAELDPGEYDCEVTVECGTKYFGVRATFSVEDNLNNTLRIR